jgi:hypothetical protein
LIDPGPPHQHFHLSWCAPARWVTALKFLLRDAADEWLRKR